MFDILRASSLLFLSCHTHHLILDLRICNKTAPRVSRKTRRHEVITHEKQTTEVSHLFILFLHILVALLYYFSNNNNRNSTQIALHLEVTALSSLVRSRTPPSPPISTSFCHSLLRFNTTLCLSNRDLSRLQAENTTILLRSPQICFLFSPPRPSSLAVL